MTSMMKMMMVRFLSLLTLGNDSSMFSRLKADMDQRDISNIGKCPHSPLKKIRQFVNNSNRLFRQFRTSCDIQILVRHN